MRKVKVGVIGTGHLGSIHVKLWKQHENSVLAGIFDTNKEQTEKLSKEYSCTSFDNVDDLIDECDALTISVPTSLHYEISKKCIKKGRHCLIEKPITSKYEDARELIQLANENMVLLQVGHVERFNPALISLKSTDLNPMFIEAHRLSQFKPRATDVSVIHDLMIHDIDIVLTMIKSEVESIDANGVGVLTDNTDIANARLKFKNGAVANITASRISASPMRKMRLFQKNAYISVDFGKPEVEVFRIGDKTEGVNGGIPATMLGEIGKTLQDKMIYYEKPEIPVINAILEEQSSFIDAIINNRPATVRAEEATEALRIAEQIDMLVRKNKWE